MFDLSVTPSRYTCAANQIFCGAMLAVEFFGPRIAQRGTDEGGLWEGDTGGWMFIVRVCSLARFVNVKHFSRCLSPGLPRL